MNLKEHEELNTQVMEILKKEHFRENMIPYVVSTLLMPKEDGTWWMCVDNRTSNQIIIKYQCHILRIDGML